MQNAKYRMQNAKCRMQNCFKTNFLLKCEPEKILMQFSSSSTRRRSYLRRAWSKTASMREIIEGKKENKHADENELQMVR